MIMRKKKSKKAQPNPPKNANEAMDMILLTWVDSGEVGSPDYLTSKRFTFEDMFGEEDVPMEEREGFEWLVEIGYLEPTGRLDNNDRKIYAIAEDGAAIFAKRGKELMELEGRMKSSSSKGGGSVDIESLIDQRLQSDRMLGGRRGGRKNPANQMQDFIINAEMSKRSFENCLESGDLDSLTQGTFYYGIAAAMATNLPGSEEQKTRPVLDKLSELEDRCFDRIRSTWE